MQKKESEDLVPRIHIAGYPYIRTLRENDRHVTYLSKDPKNREAVVKLAKNRNSAKILRRETSRIQRENGRYISGPEILDHGEEYLVTRKHDMSLGSLISEMEAEGDEKKLKSIFSDLVDGTFEISHEVSDAEHIRIATKEARKRSVRYAGTILKHAISQKVSSILGDNNPDRKIPGLPIGLIIGSCMEFLSYNPDCRGVATNHACLHLDHIFIGNDRTGRFAAIDWEHSELQPFRYEFLDDAYIFQNLLQKHLESSAILFYEEFISRHSSVLDSESIKIRMIFIKKLLGGLFEMLEDEKNNPEPYEKIERHLRYLKFFLESKDISQL